MEIVPPIDIPLDLVAVPLRSKGMEAVALGDTSTLLVGSLFVLFVMTMVWVDYIGELAHGALHMRGFDLGILDVHVVEFAAQPTHEARHDGCDDASESLKLPRIRTESLQSLGLQVERGHVCCSRQNELVPETA